MEFPDRIQRFHDAAISRIMPPDIQESDSLMYWRVRILFIILFPGLVLGTISLLLSVFIALRSGQWLLVIFNTAGFAVGAYLLFSRRPSYQVRASAMLFMTYLVGVYVTALLGPLSGGPIWLFAFAVMTGVLLGARPAVTASFLNAFTLMILGGLFYTGTLGHDIPFFVSMEQLLAAVFSFILLNLVTVLSVSILVRGLVSTHQKEMELSGRLKQEQQQLLSTTRRLEKEIEDRRHAERETRLLSAQLQRAQKMEALGQLAGGVAHDLNNILSGIVSYPDLLLMKLPDDSPLRGPITTIKNSGEKAAAIVQDLLTLARRNVSDTAVVNLNRLVEAYLGSPEHQQLMVKTPAIDLTTQLAPDLMNIRGAAVQLTKSIMNLVYNAAEAVGPGGRISIVTENRYMDAPVTGYDRVVEGDYAVLSISDDGIGIPESDLGRIFEPFYTRKEMGRSGTGLGLSVVWGTVKDHEGYIDIVSREKSGTTFTLYFPVCRDDDTTEREPPEIESYTGSGETVLVIDDVPEQLTIAADILRDLGYRVETVSSGEAAVAYLRAHSVDVLLLDMIMPGGMDGYDTYKAVCQVAPGQKAVIASGFSETSRVKKTAELGADVFVQKPYTLLKIGLAIKKALTPRDG